MKKWKKLAAVSALAVAAALSGCGEPDPQPVAGDTAATHGTPPSVPLSAAAEISGAEMSPAEMALAIAELQSAIAEFRLPAFPGQRAREIAEDHVGYGRAAGVVLFSDNGRPTFEVEVRHGLLRYMVHVDGATGEVGAVSRFEDAGLQLPQQTPAGAAEIPLPAAIVPRPPARQGGPENPPVSAQLAAELAREHLVAIGATDARFAYIYMDLEGGAWVWSVEFDGSSRSYEFYVSVETGALLKLPAAAPARPAASPAPQTGGSGQQRPQNPAISLERAIEIGYEELARRGHAGTFRAHSGMDLERGRWVWELEFRVQGGRLPLVEMYIDAETGAVAKFEWDD